VVKTARFRFDQDLTSLLPRAARAAPFEYRFNGPQTVKHLIESLGIPHTEVGDVLENDQPTSLDYVVRDGDDIVASAAAPTNESSEEPRFILDCHLGRLTSRLRMLGLDCLYDNQCSDANLATTAVGESRILLTRDRRLLMRKCIVAGHLVRNLETDLQLRDVVRHYGLAKWVAPFRRCIRCNHLLQPIPKPEIIERLEPLTRRYFEEFHICAGCGQLYWRGSHVERMDRLIAAALQ
jgi:uncharacterized protein with PIN domain